MKHTDYHLAFLRGKIEAARTALCTLQHPSFFIKTHVIHTTKVDDEGNIWFRIMQPSSKIAVDLRSFSISLAYYKKHLDFYIKIEALATAFDDDGVLLIQAKILKAEYAEIHQAAPKYGAGVFQSLTKRVMQMWQTPSFTNFYRLNSGH